MKEKVKYPQQCMCNSTEVQESNKSISLEESLMKSLGKGKLKVPLQRSCRKK